LKAAGALDIDDPKLWRRIGEVNGARVYADVEESRFRALFREAEVIAGELQSQAARGLWGCLAPAHSEAADIA